MLWHRVFISYYPGMCPCFDLNFPVFCCLVVHPSSMAPLTGLLENRTPFITVLIPREREKALQVPTDSGLVSRTDCLTLLSWKSCEELQLMWTN